MTLSRQIALAAVVSSIAFLSARAPAQQPIRVVRHAPADTIRPGEVITITFDRPVAGSPERSRAPERFVRITPHLAATVQWRDPATLRVIPNEPIEPGRRFQLTVDNTFTAIDGGRLAAPYTFAVSSHGPRYLASTPGLHGAVMGPLDPTGAITLVYSAPVDSVRLATTARLEVARERACAAKTIRYRVAEQRPVAADDPYHVHSAGLHRDGIETRFRRVVVLRPADPVPEGCNGVFVLPSFDAPAPSEMHYRTSTAASFALEPLNCEGGECVAAHGLRLTFTAPVRRDSLRGRIHVQPETPYTIDESQAPSNTWVLRFKVQSRTTYRVRVDSSLRDIFGRPLRLTSDRSIAVGDRRPSLGHQLGFFTVSRQHPMVRLTHVNVDTAEVAFVPIPDSLRGAVVATYDSDSIARMVGRLGDSVNLTIVLRARVNEERITEVPIPKDLLRRHPGSLFAVRARTIAPRPSATDSGEMAPRTNTAGPQRMRPVRVVARSEEATRRPAIIQVTNLLAHGRVSDGGGAVFVTDANTGRAVAGAAVLVRDGRRDLVATGMTDRTGVALLNPAAEWRPERAPDASDDWWGYGAYDWSGAAARFIEVTRGKDRSTTVFGAPGIDYWAPTSDAGALRPVYQPARAMIYTDRAIYRPGEKVFLGSIVRRGWLGALQAPPPGDSVRVRVAAMVGDRMEAELVRDTVLRLTEFGTAADSFVLASAAPLTTYAVRLDAMTYDGWRARGRADFRVAEYRAPQFRASVTLDSGLRYLGDPVRAHVNASYYFGAPMAGAVVRWHVSSRESGGYVHIPGLPREYVVARRFDSGVHRYTAGGDTSGVDTLDANGRLTFSAPTLRGALIGPAEVSVQVAVEDLDRQTVVAVEETTAHASAFYIAARDSSHSWYWRRGVPRTLDVLAVTPDGRRVAGAMMDVVVLRARWVPVYEAGSATPTWKVVGDTALRDSIVSADSIVRFRFTPNDAGWYEVVFSARDESGRETVTSLGGYATGGGRFGSWGTDPGALSVRLARDTVAPGDSVRLMFISPFRRAEAWVTVEREGLLAQRRMSVREGEMTVSIPVTERFVPGATVSVLLVDSAAAWRSDSMHHRIRKGGITLTVDRTSKTLQVDIRPAAARHMPGDSASVEVQLRDHHGVPVRGEVALWAVDESVLALTETEQTNPIDVIYAPRGSSLRFATTAGSLASLAPILHPPGWVRIFGRTSVALMSAVVTGTAAANEAVSITTPPRTDFRTTAFYVPSLRTDPAGIARITVKLPDNVTTYRVFAVAVTSDDRYGGGDTTIVVTKPLIARSALPRFIRAGDQFTAGAIVTNQTGGQVEATVRASATAVAGRGDLTRGRLLANGSSAETRFDWRADATPGDTAVFRFMVDGGVASDGAETSIPVRAPYSPRFHTMAGVVRGSETVRMFLPPGIDPSRSRLTVRVGTTPAPAIHAAYDQLRVYPYLCTEQLSSAGRAIVAVLRLQRAGLMRPARDLQPDALTTRLQFVVDELSRRQTSDGGIGYWTNGSWSNSSLTTYAGLLLLDARDLRANVRPRVLAGIAEYVRTSVDDIAALPEPEVGSRAQRDGLARRLGSQVAVLHYLRRAGAADETAEDELVLEEEHMSWEDRAWLAELLAGRDDPSVARELLAKVWRDVEIAGTRMTIPESPFSSTGFPSHVRPAARLLGATLAVDPSHPRLGLLVERVVQQGRARPSWQWNTQDYAAAADALTRLALWQRTTATTDTLRVASAHRAAASRLLLAAAPNVDGATSVPLEGLLTRDGDWAVLPLRISGGRQPVFYTLTVEEVPLEPPTTPDAQGIVVERWYERFDDGKPATSVKEGDLVRVRLRITVPSDREFVAAADPLPAGLEVVDLSLRTSQSLGPFETAESQAAERAGDAANPESWNNGLYGRWWGGWWSPWEHTELRDDRVLYFARILWKGTYTASYVARASTAGTFIRPPAHAEEMYNPALGGRSDGGTFVVTPK